MVSSSLAGARWQSKPTLASSRKRKYYWGCKQRSST